VKDTSVVALLIAMAPCAAAALQRRCMPLEAKPSKLRPRPGAKSRPGEDDMCDFITELLSRCIHEEFLINDDEDEVLDMQWDDDGENVLLDEDILLFESTDCVVGTDAGELEYFDVVGHVVNMALVNSLFTEQVQERPETFSDCAPLVLAFKAEGQPLPSPHETWNYNPSVGTWLLPRRACSEGLFCPTNSQASSFNFKPSVGTCLLLQTSKIDVAGSVSLETVGTSPKHLSWNMSASVGTWLLPLPKKTES
jgi:hypothetical protein